jgi:hypothetical protein
MVVYCTTLDSFIHVQRDPNIKEAGMFSSGPTSRSISIFLKVFIFLLISTLVFPINSLAAGTVHAAADHGITPDVARGPSFSPSQDPTPNSWNALGTTPLNSYVNVIAINGSDVYAGGNFTDAGGDPNADYIAKWDGSAWSALGTTPLNGEVNAIAISGTDVYTGGSFTDAGGDANADWLAKWDGSTWSALGTTPFNNTVYIIVTNGTDVYVGGYFTDAGGDANADGIARWNGSAWSPLGAGLPGVLSIVINGADIYAAGLFSNAGGDPNADYFARWNGSSWGTIGTPMLNFYAYDVAVIGTDVYVAGGFDSRLIKWNGASWSGMGVGGGFFRTLYTNGTDLYAGGYLSNAGGDPNADYIAKWDGSAWSALGTTPLNNGVLAIATSGTDVYAAGYFTDAGGDANADYIAMFHVETTPPTVSSITRVSANPINTASVDFTVTFSEDVTDVEIDDFELTTTGVTSPSITGVSGSDNTYTVTVNTGSGNGTIRLDLPASASIFDLASIPMDDLPFTSGDVYDVIKTATFADTSSSNPYWQDIEILYANGLTAGCSTSPLNFCPNTVLDRAQLAVFTLRGNFGTGYTPPPPPWDRFADDWSPGTWAEKWAEGMYNAGFTAGCATSPLRYCPWDQTPKVQAAVFGLRLKYGNSYVPPAASGTVFADMTNTAYFGTKWSEQAYADGLLPNCGTDIGSGLPLFCPNDFLSRGLGAYMIVRAKNLTMP